MPYSSANSEIDDTIGGASWRGEVSAPSGQGHRGPGGGAIGAQSLQVGDGFQVRRLRGLAAEDRHQARVGFREAASDPLARRPVGAGDDLAVPRPVHITEV